MSTKPEAAAFKESFSDLSIKQLKNMLKAKAATFGKAKKDTVLKKLDQMAEKDQLPAATPGPPRAHAQPVSVRV